MQNYYDTATNQQYAFNPDVVITGEQGAWVFTAANKQVLGPYPATLTPGTAPYVPPPPPTLAQQAAALIAGGITITSTGTPALDGVYVVASGVPFGREDIGTEAQFISTFSEFTNGTTALQWPLIGGEAFVTFPSTAAFLNFAKAAGQFYAACQAVIATGKGTLPSAAATIP